MIDRDEVRRLVAEWHDDTAFHSSSSIILAHPNVEKLIGLGMEAVPHLIGAKLSYVDLSLFQVVEGLRYAFPKGAALALKKAPRVRALHAGVLCNRRVTAYLASKRRIPFNEQGIFRRYPELDQ